MHINSKIVWQQVLSVTSKYFYYTEYVEKNSKKHIIIYDKF